jgi:hypothetical protein
MTFKQWLESVDTFPRAEDLSTFMSYAHTVSIRTHQAMFRNAKTPEQKALMKEIIDLADLLGHIHKNIEGRLPEISDGDKFQGKPTPSLQINQYQHKFPDLPSVLRVLRTIGSHYFIEKPTSQALSDRLNSLNSALQHARTAV